MLDRFAAAAQAYGFELDVDAVLEQPPSPSSVSSSSSTEQREWFDNEREARVGAALQPAAAALVDDLAGRVVDESDGVRAYSAALERLERGRLRDALAELGDGSLFAGGENSSAKPVTRSSSDSNGAGAPPSSSSSSTDAPSSRSRRRS